MKIWIDVCHIPQYNFFKQLILQLVKNGDVVTLTVMDRGRTIKIVQNEIGDVSGVSIVPMGKHRMTKWSALWDANILRMIKLCFWVPKQHFDVAFSTNIFTSLFGKIYHIPNYCFGDDPQVYDIKYNCKWATKAHQCIYEWTLDKPIPQKLLILKCLKEWAYLNPKLFAPNIYVLDKYGVQPKEYMFIREVSVGTINYAGQGIGAVLNVKHLIPNDKKVLFSLEEKNRRGEYPDDWILLQEPIEDIHSLIYYSCGLVSSGDSMAREAALLGVPAYYLGIRHSMPANLAASKVANLQNEKTMPFGEWVKTLDVAPAEAEKRQSKLRKKIDSEFIDINDYMMQLVEKNKH